MCLGRGWAEGFHSHYCHPCCHWPDILLKTWVPPSLISSPSTTSSFGTGWSTFSSWRQHITNLPCLKSRSKNLLRSQYYLLGTMLITLGAPKTETNIAPALRGLLIQNRQPTWKVTRSTWTAWALYRGPCMKDDRSISSLHLSWIWCKLNYLWGEKPLTNQGQLLKHPSKKQSLDFFA